MSDASGEDGSDEDVLGERVGRAVMRFENEHVNESIMKMTSDTIVLNSHTALDPELFLKYVAGAKKEFVDIMDSVTAENFTDMERMDEMLVVSQVWLDYGLFTGEKANEIKRYRDKLEKKYEELPLRAMEKIRNKHASVADLEWAFLVISSSTSAIYRPVKYNKEDVEDWNSALLYLKNSYIDNSQIPTRLRNDHYFRVVYFQSFTSILESCERINDNRKEEEGKIRQYFLNLIENYVNQ